MPSLKQIHSAPCATCRRDTMFVALICFECKTPMVLSRRASWEFDPAILVARRQAKRAKRLKDRERMRRARALKAINRTRA